MDGKNLGAEKVTFIHRDNVTSHERVANIRENALLDLPDLDFKRICICASGPSLRDNIDEIRARWESGWDVAAMNGSHAFLIENGIIPKYMFLLDARPVNLSFVEAPRADITYIIATQAHPEIFHALRGMTVMKWNLFHDNDGLATLKELSPHQAYFAGRMNVGQSCLGALWALGYKTWHLFGYDGSCRKNSKHAFVQMQNEEEPIEEFLWPLANGVPIAGMTKRYYATPTMAHAATSMPAIVTQYRQMGIDIEIFGEGLIPDMVAALAGKNSLATVRDLTEVTPLPPPPKPRKYPVSKLQIVCWKWRGHIPYFAEDVNVWARMVDRHLGLPHELVCVTDDPDGIDGGIRIVPLWRDYFEHGKDWHRLRIFSEEMTDIIGPRFVSMDLDTVICGPLDPLFDHDAPFKAWADPNRDGQYCTALFQMDAGAYPHVFDEFDVARAIALRESGKFTGYDQAWISEVLPGQPMWTRTDGVLSFKGDILRAIELTNAHPSCGSLPEGTRVVNFHGKFNPRDIDVQALCPWVADHWQ